MQKASSNSKLLVAAGLIILGRVTLVIGTSFGMSFLLYRWPPSLQRTIWGGLLGVVFIAIGSTLVQDKAVSVFRGLVHQSLAGSSLLILGLMAKFHYVPSATGGSFTPLETTVALMCLGMVLSYVILHKRRLRKVQATRKSE